MTLSQSVRSTYHPCPGYQRFAHPYSTDIIKNSSLPSPFGAGSTSCRPCLAPSRNSTNPIPRPPLASAAYEAAGLPTPRGISVN